MQWLTKALVLVLLAGCGVSDPGATDTGAADGMQPIKVQVVEHDGRYRLLRGGLTYRIKGAGIDPLHLDALAANGGNSLRTWSVDRGPEQAGKLLDRAHALGLSVSLCLEIAPERFGLDYDDPEAVAAQFERARAHVLKYKDHPALLTWIIGNELNYDYKNPRVFAAVNDIARMIHELDPNHPATTTLSGFEEETLADVERYAPDLDFLSFQIYGDLVNLPKHIAKANFTAPYFVTEWGAIGHWEVAKTSWGAPIEQTSSDKAASYARSYEKVLEPYGDQAIGNYVFLWGQKQERTSTWYGMFLDSGESTEAVDVMHYIWNGRWPDNRAPRVKPPSLDNNTAINNVILAAGEDYEAAIEVIDDDGDRLRYRWELRHESTATEVGGDQETIPPVIEGLIADPGQAVISLTAPAQSGAYRLFAFVYDDNNHAAHANIPFYVK
ncbi:MAG: glycoside hydrolase family 2 TIM barrel-domain containing protein [Halieaceae bacterium]